MFCNLHYSMYVCQPDCYFKNRVILSQHESVFNITTNSNSFCPSYASYLAKYAPLSRTVHGNRAREAINYLACNFTKCVPIGHSIKCNRLAGREVYRHWSKMVTWYNSHCADFRIVNLHYKAAGHHDI